MHFNPDKPFNELPELPPRAELETAAVLKATTRASRALAELKGRTHNIPNPTILLNTLALQEAKLSSEIENIFTTNDELFRGLAANGDSADLSPHSKEVLHYRDALWHGINALRERPFVSTNLVIEIVNIIKENKASIRNLSGTSCTTHRLAKSSTLHPKAKVWFGEKWPIWKSSVTIRLPTLTRWSAPRLRIISSKPFTRSSMAMDAPGESSSSFNSSSVDYWNSRFCF